MRRILAVAAACAVAVGGMPATAAVTFQPAHQGDGRRMWTFEAGVAWITSNNIDDLLRGKASINQGPAGGEVFVFTASRRLGEIEWDIAGRTFRPRLELPITIEIVDENSRSPFLTTKATLVVRWVDFPWNHLLVTTFATGVGLCYTSKVWLMDIQRHPLDDRSHVKFDWPLQLTFALPDYPQHQLKLFIAHHSGGRVFDRGGVNSLGIGYRLDF